VLGHNAVADAEPQTGATLIPSGGEKRVEQLANMLGWNPGAVIGKRNPDEAFYLLSLYAELAPVVGFNHGVLGIQYDVQKDLLNLVRVNCNPGQVGGKLNRNLNIACFQFLSP
jgi:hypothetical protein